MQWQLAWNFVLSYGEKSAKKTHKQLRDSKHSSLQEALKMRGILLSNQQAFF